MYNPGTCFQTTNESSTKPFTKSHSILDRRFPLTYTYLQFTLKARASHRVHWTTLLSTAPTFNALIWPTRNSYVPLYSWYVYKHVYSTSLFSSEAEPYYTTATNRPGLSCPTEKTCTGGDGSGWQLHQNSPLTKLPFLSSKIWTSLL